MEIEQTQDGSPTLFVPELDEHYHSIKGAVTESRHIFIRMGLEHSRVPSPHVLEIGFGTGLNAFLTLLAGERLKLIKERNMKQTLLILMTLLMTACSGRPPQTSERTITVTIEPIRYFTELIAGDKFKVVSMVPGGNSPETYDPTPQQLVHLSGSEAYFRIGYIGFEQTWMQRLTENAPQMKVFDLSEGISLIREKEHVHGDHTHAGGVEPHIWNSPANARLIARNIYEAICRLDPEHKDFYTRNLNKANREIDETDKEIRTLLNGKHDRAFLIYHPALSYYARDYGLRQVCMEENGKEPSPTHLKELVDLCKQENIRIVFVQKEFDTRNAELIAKETGTQLVSVNPLSEEWKKELIQTTKALCHE